MVLYTFSETQSVKFVTCLGDDPLPFDVHVYTLYCFIECGIKVFMFERDCALTGERVHVILLHCTMWWSKVLSGSVKYYTVLHTVPSKKGKKSVGVTIFDHIVITMGKNSRGGGGGVTLQGCAQNDLSGGYLLGN